MAEPVPRRRFIDLLLSGQFVALALAVLYPVLKYLYPRATADVAEVKVGPAADLAPGSARFVKLGAKPVLVMRLADGQLRALSASCTHLNCTVQFRKEQSDIWCACHDGHYDLSGKNVSGPPPRPLTPLVAEVRDGDVWVKRS